MPTISEYLQVAAGGAGVVFANVGVWVQLVNNTSGVAYVSTSATDSQGKFTVQNVPAGSYTVNTGPSAVGTFTSTGNTAYVIGDQTLTLNVKDFGATGNGTTDDSTAIQNTFNAANTAGGGTVYFPAGVYAAAGLNFYGKIRYSFAANEGAILKLKDGANTFLLQTNNFASLAAGGGGSGPGTSTGGETLFTIEDATIDGNKANNGSATVPLVRIYGYGYVLRDVHIRNGNHENLYSEWSTSLPSPGNDSMMAQITSLKSHDAGRVGVHFNGPHDSQWDRGEVYNNNTSAQTGAAGSGIWVDSKGSGLTITDVHSWGLTQSYAAYLGATGSNALGSTFEGAVTAQIALDANDTFLIGGFIYGAGSSVPVGIEFGTTGTRQDIMVNGVKINNCTTAAMKFVNDGGAYITADIFQSGGTLTSGTISGLTRLDIRTNGIAGGRSRFPVDVEIGQGKALKLYNAAESGFISAMFDGTKLLWTWPVVSTVQTPAFTTSYTPNFAAGDTIAMAQLTNNITVNAPTGGVAGQEVTFIWLQDGTGGRTITYNAVFKTTGTGAVTAITTGANTRTIDKFKSDDGTNWRLASRITGQ